MKRYKGTTDNFNIDMRIKKSLRNSVTKIVKEFGYQEYEIPTLEYKELYLKKSSEELINKQSFILKDYGKKDIMLRPEGTPSLARYLAQNYPTLKKPTRLFNLSPMFRFENPQKGRLREFYQYNVDFAYNTRKLAIKENFTLISNIMKELNINTYSINVNNRDWMEKIIISFGWGEVSDILNLLDNYSKKEIDLSNVSNKESLEQFLKITSIDSLILWLEENGMNEIILEIKEWKFLFKNNVTFCPWIVRGLNYYTGFVFEIFYSDSSVMNRALGGGGEYDLVNQLIGKELPMIGFALGEIPLLQVYNTSVNSKPCIDCFIASDNIEEDMETIFTIKNSIEGNVVILDKNIKINKALNFLMAEYEAKYFIYIGENERKEKKYLEKNLETREQKFININYIDD